MKRTNLPKMLMKEERKMQHICGANRFKQNSKVSEINYSDIKMSENASSDGCLCVSVSVSVSDTFSLILVRAVCVNWTELSVHY